MIHAHLKISQWEFKAYTFKHRLNIFINKKVEYAYVFLDA